MASAVKTNFVPLSQSHPLLAAQWHPTKNGNVSPDEVWENYTKKFFGAVTRGMNGTNESADLQLKNKGVHSVRETSCS